MKWFPGSISEAVTAAKQRGAIFVVFVEGKDDNSVQAARTLEEETISSRMDRDDFVSVKVEADTEAFVFFQQIYEKVSVPSLYFIGGNGVPVFTLVGGLNPSELASKLDSHFPQAGKTGGTASSSFIQSEQSADSSGAISQPRKPETCAPKSDASGGSSTERELTAEEKVERAKQLVELQRRQKIAQEREEEKKREIERRLLGKDLQALKQKQHEAEIKMALDERMREKAAEAVARDKVLKQIAQDKLERKQRELALQQTVQQQQQNQGERSAATASGGSSSDSTTARIQFRLPSGAPHLGKFEATSTLGSLRSYVARNIELPFQQFAMSTTFPRRDLLVEDDEKTLTELELVPTAVILILPVKNSKVTSVVTSDGEVGYVSRLIWALFAPIMSIYNFVMGYFSGAPRNLPENRGDPNPGARSPNPNAERFGRILDQPSGSINRNILGGPSTTIRSRGNIHRLHSGGDDNDENNTWNGNSTQQM